MLIDTGRYRGQTRSSDEEVVRDVFFFLLNFFFLFSFFFAIPDCERIPKRRRDKWDRYDST